jgi:Arc/MetJ-type ribon-helix-helix transcriptional regulator
MKKRISVTIDEDVFEMLQRLPRRISASELVNGLLREFLEEREAKERMLVKEVIKGYEEGLGNIDDKEFLSQVKKNEHVKGFKELLEKAHGGIVDEVLVEMSSNLKKKTDDAKKKKKK